MRASHPEPDPARRPLRRAAGARRGRAVADKPACDVPAYLLTSESTLAKVAAAVKGGKPLNVLVVGSRSSTIPHRMPAPIPPSCRRR